MVNKRYIKPAAFVIILATIMIALVITSNITTNEPSETSPKRTEVRKRRDYTFFHYEYYSENALYDLYYVDAPFGTVWIDIEGRFFLLSGYITSDLKESYTVKYFNGNKLHSKMVEAEETAVIADGTFQYEVTTIYEEYYQFGEYVEREIWNQNYTIHIPQLPVLNQNTTCPCPPNYLTP